MIFTNYLYVRNETTVISVESGILISKMAISTYKEGDGSKNKRLYRLLNNTFLPGYSVSIYIQHAKCQWANVIQNYFLNYPVMVHCTS